MKRFLVRGFSTGGDFLSAQMLCGQSVSRRRVVVGEEKSVLPSTPTAPTTSSSSSSSSSSISTPTSRAPLTRRDRAAVRASIGLDAGEVMSDLFGEAWLDASRQGSRRVQRVAERGLSRLTRDMASIALDKEASLATGSITPLRRRERAARAPVYRTAGAAEAAATKSFLGEEAQERIQGTFLTFSKGTQAGVVVVLAGKAGQQDEKHLDTVFSPQQELVLLTGLARKQGIKLASRSDRDKVWMSQGNAELKLNDINRVSPLPFHKATARALPDVTSPLGRLVGYTASNVEELAAEARSIAWGVTGGGGGGSGGGRSGGGGGRGGGGGQKGGGRATRQ